MNEIILAPCDVISKIKQNSSDMNEIILASCDAGYVQSCTGLYSKERKETPRGNDSKIPQSILQKKLCSRVSWEFLLLQDKYSHFFQPCKLVFFDNVTKKNLNIQ
jgi:hypothetical protein